MTNSELRKLAEAAKNDVPAFEIKGTDDIAAFVQAAKPAVILALLDRIAKLEAVLRPFAVMAIDIIAQNPDHSDDVIVHSFDTRHYTFGDLRRATEAWRDK